MILKSIILTVVFMAITSCTQQTYSPTNCDIIFQVAETTEYSKAITDATAQKDCIKFDHVGMIVIQDQHPFVLEATSKKGVSMIPFEDFIKNSETGYVIKRVTISFNPEKVINVAKSHLGEPYDWSYLPNNGKMYCSELIYESFLSDKNEHLFQAHPMNFKNKDGVMPQFWIDQFKKLGEKIPEGVLGTNPNDLSKEKILEEIYRDIPMEK